MELFTTVKDTLISHLHTVPWMDGETRAEAQDKVRPRKGDSMGMCSGCQRGWDQDSTVTGEGCSVHQASVTADMPHRHPGDTTRGGDRAVSQRKPL